MFHCFSLESDKMTALWLDDSSTFTFYVPFSNSLPNWATFVKEVFYLMFSLESDEMTVFWPNDRVTFAFYVTYCFLMTYCFYVTDCLILDYVKKCLTILSNAWYYPTWQYWTTLYNIKDNWTILAMLWNTRQYWVLLLFNILMSLSISQVIVIL